jgi:hypothetical protein
VYKVIPRLSQGWGLVREASASWTCLEAKARDQKGSTMKKPSFLNRVSTQATSVVCLLSLLIVLAACTFRQPESTVSPATKDPTGCLASQGQLSLRDCLTAVHNARLVDAYTLGQLQ